MRNIEEYTNEYLKSDFELNVQVTYRRKKVLHAIKQYHPTKLLEIGCGMEPLFPHLDLSLFEKIVVIEPSEIFFKHAQNLADQMTEQKKICVINKTVEEVADQLDIEFDMIICSGLLHEIEDPKIFLTLIKRLCTKITVLHLNVPNAMSLHRLLAYEMGLIEDVHHMSERNYQLQQNQVFDAERLEKLIESVGFKVISQGTYFCKPFTHDQMQQLQKIGFLTEQMLEGLDRLVEFLPEYGSEIFMNAVLQAQNKEE